MFIICIVLLINQIKGFLNIMFKLVISNLYINCNSILINLLFMGVTMYGPCYDLQIHELMAFDITWEMSTTEERHQLEE